MGVPYADGDEFRRWSDDVGNLLDLQRSMAGLDRLWRYMRGLVGGAARGRRAQPAAHHPAREGVTMTPDEAAMLGAGLLFAGHETTVTAMMAGRSELLTRPSSGPRCGPDTIDGAVGFRSSREDPGRASSREGLLRYAREDVEFA